MSGSVRSRLRSRYEKVRERDRAWVMSLSLPKLEGRLVPMLVVLLILNFIDVLSTLVAFKATPYFVELNPIVSGLLYMGFSGFMIALLLKYAPIIPLLYASFARDTAGRHPMGIRMVKISAFVVLVAADVFYVYVVGSNLGSLLRLFY
jgi:hypothetical protein